ncbi:unnamed protein product, partial [marine sediment metagenome]
MVPRKDSTKKTSKKNMNNKKDVKKSTKKKDERKIPRVMKVAFGLLAILFTLISALGRLLLTLF